MNELVQIGDFVSCAPGRNIYVVTALYEGFYQVKPYIEYDIGTQSDYYGIMQKYVHKLQNVDALNTHWYKIPEIPRKKYAVNQAIFTEDVDHYSSTYGQVYEAKIIAVTAEMSNPYNKTSMGYLYFLANPNERRASGHRMKMSKEQFIFPKINANSVWNNLCSESSNLTK